MKKNAIRYCCICLFAALNNYALLAQSPAIQFQRCLGGTNDDKANSIIKTTSGFLLVGSSKSNDVNVSGHHGSTDTTDAWVVKLDDFGGIEWQKSIGGNGSDKFNSVVSTADNGYLCVGSTTSNDADVSGNHGFLDFWLVKLDAAGNILWSKCLGGTGNEEANSVRQTNDGGFIVCGYSTSVNGNLSANAGAEDAWIVKLDASGNIQWQKLLGSNQRDFAYDIIQTSDSNYAVSCYTQPNQVFYISAKGFIAKLGKDSGNLIWGQNSAIFSGGTLDRIGGYNWAIRQMPNGNLVVSQTSLNNGSGNSLEASVYDINSGTQLKLAKYGVEQYESVNSYPGPNSLIAYADSSIVDCTDGYNSGTINGLVVKSSPTNILFASYTTMYGGANDHVGIVEDDHFKGVVALSGNDLFLCGNTTSNNRDVSGNHGGIDVWIVKLGSVNTIKGKTFIDYNRNGLMDGGDIFYASAKVETKKAITTNASVSLGNGDYKIATDTGSFITTATALKPYYSVFPVSASTVFTTYSNTSTVNFGFQPTAGKRDVEINLAQVTPARPGFETKYAIIYKNNGTDTADGVVRFIKPGKLIFADAAPLPDNTSGDTISWNYNGLRPLSSGRITITLNVPPPPVVIINDTLKSVTDISSTGDLDTSDNYASLKQIVSGSFDPNDKTENNGGFLTKVQAGNKEYLHYTIRFQNTGTDTAFKVVVRDTVDARFDLPTLEVTDTSHAYELTVADGNKLTWTFNNIKLPDSMHNELASHGYISYRIKLKSLLTPGDSIRNIAAIYFDFNPSVKTNIQVTTVKNNPPPTPVVTGLQNNYCSNQGLQRAKIANLPSTGNGTTAIVRLDNSVIAIAADSTFGFDAGLLTAGNHQVKVIFSNNTGSDSLLLNFKINAALTPDVNLTSNISTVINLTDAVVITATNASGGGASPKYTFAKDKGITNILQAESSSNTFTLQPNTLTVGANWVYARMKTSDTCFTAQANIDSINITRSAVTGIADVDFPNQLINFYPNPFADIINITGLNSGKTYTIIISNTNGQKLYSQQVINTSNTVIHKEGLQSGKYWLSLYDYKKRTLIGTISLIKQ